MSISASTFTQKPTVNVFGVMDAQSTQNVQTAGFPVAYLNGYDVVASHLAKTNEGLISPSEMADHVRHIKENIQLPLIVDAQSGFGNQLTTYFVAQSFERAGAAGLVINDQIFPSHTANSEVELIDFSDFVAKLKAAKDACENPDTLLFAELDGSQSYGVTGVTKRIAYLQQHDLADVILLGHVAETQIADLNELAATQPLGLVLNMVRDQWFAGSTTYNFGSAFLTGYFSQARQQAEQEVLQQFTTAKVEA